MAVKPNETIKNQINAITEAVNVGEIKAKNVGATIEDVYDTLEMGINTIDNNLSSLKDSVVAKEEYDLFSSNLVSALSSNIIPVDSRFNENTEISNTKAGVFSLLLSGGATLTDGSENSLKIKSAGLIGNTVLSNSELLKNCAGNLFRVRFTARAVSEPQNISVALGNTEPSASSKSFLLTSVFEEYKADLKMGSVHPSRIAFIVLAGQTMDVEIKNIEVSLIESLPNRIKGVENLFTHIYQEADFSLGTFVSSSGQLQTSSTRMRSQKIGLSDNGKIIVSSDNMVSFAVGSYKASDGSFVASTGWLSSPRTEEYTNTDLKYLVVFRFNDNSEVNISELYKHVNLSVLDYSIDIPSVTHFPCETIYVAHMAGKLWGNSPVIPEESISSMMFAHWAGFKYAEIDARLTLDKQWVCMHDVSINRTMYNPDATDLTETVNIASLSLDELKAKYVYKSSEPRYRTPIFTLEEFLCACRTYNITPYIHAGDIASGSVASFLKVIKAHTDNFVFMGADTDVLKTIRNEFPLSLLIYQNNNTVELNTVLSILNFVGHPCGFSSLNLDDITEEFCKSLRSHGYYVQASIPYAENRCLEFQQKGVNLFLTNGFIPPLENKSHIINSVNFENGNNGLKIDGKIEKTGIRLEPGQSISAPYNYRSISAVELELKFTGSISISVSKISKVKAESAGNEICLFRYIVFDGNELTILADENTLIKELKFLHHDLKGSFDSGNLPDSVLTKKELSVLELNSNTYVDNSNGELITYTGWYSRKYKIEPGKIYIASGRAANANTCMASYYNTEEKFIGTEFEGTGVPMIYAFAKLNPPAEAAFVRINGTSDMIPALYSKENRFSTIEQTQLLEKRIAGLESGNQFAGLRFSVLSDSVGTSKNNNAVEFTVLQSDIDNLQTLQGYPTYYDIGTQIGNLTVTEDIVGKLTTFTPQVGDMGKTIGKVLNYNDLTPNELWWGIMADHFGMTLLQNVSWSGASICSHEDTETLCTSYAWHPAQINKLASKHMDGNLVTPDLVFISRGINDFSHAPYARLTDFGMKSTSIPQTDLNNGIYGFKEAYAITIRKIREAYPHALVICSTLNNFKRVICNEFPTQNGTNTLPEFNQAIREVAEVMGCEVIEFDNCGITFENLSFYTSDGTHPNLAGHRLMAKTAIKKLIGI